MSPLNDRARLQLAYGLKSLRENWGKKPQVPPLRYASVGMTILLREMDPKRDRKATPQGLKPSTG